MTRVSPQPAHRNGSKDIPSDDHASQSPKIPRTFFPAHHRPAQSCVALPYCHDNHSVRHVVAFQNDATTSLSCDRSLIMTLLIKLMICWFCDVSVLPTQCIAMRPKGSMSVCDPHFARTSDRALLNDAELDGHRATCSI